MAWAWHAAALLVASLLLVGCRSRVTGDTVDLGPECNDYVAQFRACLSHIATPDVASARVAGLQAVLLKAIQGDAGSSSTQQVCKTDLAQLKQTCP